MHMQTRELVLPAWLSGRASLKASIPLQIIFIAKNITQEILVWGDVYLLCCDLQRPHQTAQLLRKRATSLEIGASVSCRSQSRTFDNWQTKDASTGPLLCNSAKSEHTNGDPAFKPETRANTAQLVLHLDRREEVHMPRSTEVRVKFLSRWQSPPRKSWWTQVCRFSLLILRGTGGSAPYIPGSRAGRRDGETRSWDQGGCEEWGDRKSVEIITQANCYLWGLHASLRFF